MLLLAIMLTMAAPDSSKELFRVKDFVIGVDFAKTEIHPGHPFMQKVAKSGCSVSFIRDQNDDPIPNYYLTVTGGDSIHILAYHYEGNDMVVRRVGNAWPPKETDHVEHFVATTKRGRIVTVEWSSGFYGEKAWMKLEVDKAGHLRYAYAKTKEHSGHLAMPFRTTREAECDFD